MTSVLIVRLGALGDVVHAMPVVAALRSRWPDVRIDWLVDPRYVDVVQLVAGVNRAVAFDPRALVASGRRAETLTTIAALRRTAYDVVLDLQGLLESAAAARLVGGVETIGFAREELREPAARFFYTRTVDVPAGQHVIFKNLALLRAMGIEAAAPVFSLSLAPSESVEQAVRAAGAFGYAVVNPGAAWPNKQWPAERFGKLASALYAECRLRALVVWGPEERALAEAVVDASDGTATMAPPTTAVDLFSLMRSARLAVSGDTGPLHIAAAVGTPVVALFGPTLPERNGPWHADDVSLRPASACDCPYERRCRRGTSCITEITVKDVVWASISRLDRVAGEARS